MLHLQSHRPYDKLNGQFVTILSLNKTTGMNIRAQIAAGSYPVLCAYFLCKNVQKGKCYL